MNNNFNCLCIISQIPSSFSLYDLRYFFSTFIELRYFNVFHYLRRKQLDNFIESKYNCCIIDLKDRKYKDKFIEFYHNKQWQTNTKHFNYNCLINGPILLSDLKLNKLSNRTNDIYSLSEDYIFNKQLLKNKYLTRRERKQKLLDNDYTSITHNNDNLLELYPPNGLPNGNIGTPLSDIKNMINKCIIPSSLIQSLGILDKETIYRKYGRVYYCHPGESIDIHNNSNYIQPIIDYINKSMDFNDTDNSKSNNYVPTYYSDGEQSAEEWEREEQFPKEKEEYLYENNLEVIWDKGSSGLVFYTDACYWDTQNGDFDERCADEYNISDEKESKEIIINDNKNNTHKQYRNKKKKSNYTKQYIINTMKESIGYKVLLKNGWKIGKGLGKYENGTSRLISIESCNNKFGIGYSKNDIQSIIKYNNKSISNIEYKISSIYDNNIPSTDNFKFRQVNESKSTPYIIKNEPIAFISYNN